MYPEAVLTDQDRRFVYVVDTEGNASYRQVTLGASVGDQRVVTTGLNDGDRVIVGGILSVRPGVAVAPRETSAKSGASRTSS